LSRRLLLFLLRTVEAVAYQRTVNGPAISLGIPRRAYGAESLGGRLTVLIEQ